jgi:hypothetical protein
MRDRKILDKRGKIPHSRGNGEIHYEIWEDEFGNVTRYNLAYINHSLYAKDNGRVIGYDNAHGPHHRHRMGITELISLEDFFEIEQAFIRDWHALLNWRRT